MERSSADYFNGSGILQSSAIKETILLPLYVAVNNLECHGGIGISLIAVRLKDVVVYYFLDESE